ncbi:hypothetical protein [Actinomadura sp. SCN-SB]|uniref:hypothetical protein n=1 Tax=Actinomadura sp. SCN-SB TaxID=3373092 RepID=UPI00375002C0
MCSDAGPRTKRDELHGEAVSAGTCREHLNAIGRELARHLISNCTNEGALVVEAFTSSDHTLAMAAGAGRRALACVPYYPLARYIGAQLRATLTEQELAKVGLRPCRPDQMHLGMADHLGQVDLVIAAPPPYEIGGCVAKEAADRDCPACRADLWMLGREHLSGFLSSAWRVLRPGGHLAVITTARYQDDGRLSDPTPQVIRSARAVGLRYSQHVIAVRVPVEGDTLYVQATSESLAQLRDIRSRALPPAARVHADVSIFSKPSRVKGLSRRGVRR